MSDFDWRSATPEQVDLEYSPSRYAKRPLEDYLVDYARLSSGVEQSRLRVPGQPLLIYIHGGYWQRLSAADSLFNGADALRHGVSLHAVEYDLAPRASIEEIVDQCITDVVSAIATLEPRHVVVAGCSAGAHLAAMSARDERISSAVNGIALLSGIYDLRPLVVTPTNDALGLDETRAAALSPLMLDAPVVRRAICAVGLHESGEFIRQNRDYAARLREAGADVHDCVVDGRDHFDLPYDLLAEGTVVGDWVLDTLGVQ